MNDQTIVTQIEDCSLEWSIWHLFTQIHYIIAMLEKVR